jgi:rhodanese-related sulfurtransferase
VLAGRTLVVAWKDIAQMENEDYILLDVRTEEEFANGHIKSAINLPVDEPRNRLSELDKNKTIVEYCQVGLRGYVADTQAVKKN